MTHDQVEAMTLADTLIVMNAGRVEQIGSPAEIYRRPASVFVAGFMGAPAMNLLPATVGMGGTVTLDGVALGVAVGQSSLAGTTLSIGIRPENVVLSTVTGQGLPATVELVEELGGSRVAYCNLHGSEVAVVLPPGDEQIDGSMVWLTFPPQLIQGFDRITGLRLDVLLARAATPPKTARRRLRRAGRRGAAITRLLA